MTNKPSSQNRMNIYFPAYLRRRAEDELPPTVKVAHFAIEGTLQFLDSQKQGRCTSRASISNGIEIGIARCSKEAHPADEPHSYRINEPQEAEAAS